jgi:hypothetical protein
MFFYHKRQKNPNGSFLEPSNSDLHKLTITYIRKLLDGGVGDTLPITKETASRSNMTLTEFIESINPSRSGQPLLRTNQQWLFNALDAVKNANTAKIIFQACLLPDVHASASFGDRLEEMTFYRGQNNWTLDHLIPQNSFAPTLQPSVGDGFRDSLRNYCPIKGTDNSSYRAKDCALKLNDATSINTYIRDPNKVIAGSPHPFIAGLLQKQGNTSNAELNHRDYLSIPSPSPTNRCYGQERLEILRDLLLLKI